MGVCDFRGAVVEDPEKIRGGGIDYYREIILQLNSEDSVSIKTSQDLIKDPNSKANLI